MDVFIVRYGGVEEGSGSGGSAFSLISAASKDALPSSAAKNTIAVITDQSIGKLYMQPTIPTEAVNGDLVILTSKSSKTISISEDGNIEFAIDGAYINIDGAWSFVDTYIRLDDAWVLLWSGQLYFNGNQYTEYLGDWVSVAKKAASNSTASIDQDPLFADENGALTVNTATNLTGGIFYTTNQIDLTPYKTIVFEGKFTRGGTVARNFTAAAWSRIGTYYTSNMLAYTQPSVTSFTTIKVDVSEINAVAHVGLGITQSKAVITRAYLVPNEM